MVSGVKGRPHRAVARQRDHAGVNLVAADRDGGLWAVQAAGYVPFYGSRRRTRNV
jgi:hypothetical protein